MPDLPPDAAGIAREVAWIARQPGTVRDRAEALQAPLHRLVPFEGFHLALLDPDPPAFTTLEGTGYDPTLLAHLESTERYRETERAGLTRPRPPICLRDCPVPVSERRSWHEHLAPAGFREALALGLFSGNREQVGLLTMHTTTTGHPTDAARDIIGLLAPTISRAVDPFLTLVPLTRIVGEATGGIVLTRGGRPIPLPGLPEHPVLRPGSGALVAVRRLAVQRAHTTFLWPGPDLAKPTHMRITALATPVGSPTHLAMVVLVCPAGDLRRLTPRELEVVGLLIEGWSNRRIASGLGITERTVAAHVEHVMVKLDAESRTVAAVRALRLGLYVPPDILPRTGSGTRRRGVADPAVE